MSARSKPEELHITRVYDAPLQLVWDAWTDPEQVAQWWGPRGFTLTTHSKDLRPGGHWVYTMHGPDGVDYPNKTQYLQVEERSLLVYDHGGNDDRPPMFRVTVRFREVRGKTHMAMTMTLPSAEAAVEARKFIRKAGGDATWDRLAEHLAQEREGKDRFVINRSFDAPIETLFRMWTEPAHLSRWLPPPGFRMEFRRAGIHTGGESFFEMSNDAGLTMYGRARYLEVAAPDRIVYTQEFCDADEQPARHPLAATWPATMLTIITLEAEEDGRTRVTISSEVHGEATQTERNTFRDGRSGMTLGWTASFDKLEEVLDS